MPEWWAQVTLNIDGTIIRGEEPGADAIVAADAVIDVMDRRVERYKGKVYRSQRAKNSGRNLSIRTEGAPAPSEAEEIPEEVISEVDGRVVRMKRFPIKPMALDEATFQMELLGHASSCSGWRNRGVQPAEQAPRRRLRPDPARACVGTAPSAAHVIPSAARSLDGRGFFGSCDYIHPRFFIAPLLRMTTLKLC